MCDVYVVSAFCKEGKGGNKAGVVLNGTELSREEKMQIAKKLGYSETAFVFDSNLADFEVQYYTPTEEVPMCGHATIATFSLLHKLGIPEKNVCTIETKAGILRIEIQEDGMILMQQNPPKYLEIIEADEFKSCVETAYIDKHLPVQVVTTGLKDIMMPIDTREHLTRLLPNFDELAKLSQKKDVVGAHAFTLENEEDVDAICRNFAPLYGIDEESATGTASCALASYLFRYVEKKTQYIFEQGHNLDAVSRIVVNVRYHDDVIDEIHVGGYGAVENVEAAIL